MGEVVNSACHLANKAGRGWRKNVLISEKVYENISSADFGTMTAFLTSILFFLFTVVCGFIVVLTVLNRILKIYMIAPFAGVALSTLAAGGQTANVGYF